ncbi:putative exported protein [Candidatus Burkholderia humilis]|nr:putative exported protein [Candidatus Burkholderia humilis]
MPTTSCKSPWPQVLAAASFVLAAASLTPTVSSAQSDEAASASARAAQSQQLSAANQQFVQDAGTAGATEIAASKLALKNSSDKQVKDFAQRMIADHTRLTRNLDVIAKRHGITAPPSADSSVIGSLQNLKGVDFNKAYIEQVAVGGHQKAVDLFRKESESGNDSALKAAAAKALPVISHHFAMAQQLAKNKAAS